MKEELKLYGTSGKEFEAGELARVIEKNSAKDDEDATNDKVKYIMPAINDGIYYFNLMSEN